MTTTLFHNGKIIDGRGRPSYKGSVLVEGSLIKDLFPAGIPVPETDSVIDAEGLAIAPGFIDMHSHSDWVLPAEGHSEILKCLVEQGVTSIVGGNCGFFPAPINSKAVKRGKAALDMLIARPFDFSWNTMDEFLDHLEAAAPVLNIAEQVGHASLRVAVGETRRGKMPLHELSRRLDEAAKALDEGACGLSFGLGYDPGMYLRWKRS